MLQAAKSLITSDEMDVNQDDTPEEAGPNLNQTVVEEGEVQGELIDTSKVSCLVAHSNKIGCTQPVPVAGERAGLERYSRYTVTESWTNTLSSSESLLCDNDGMNMYKSADLGGRITRI